MRRTIWSRKAARQQTRCGSRDSKTPFDGGDEGGADAAGVLRGAAIGVQPSSHESAHLALQGVEAQGAAVRSADVSGANSLGADDAPGGDGARVSVRPELQMSVDESVKRIFVSSERGITRANGRDESIDELEQDLALGREVVVHEPRSEPSGLADGRHRRALVALFGHDREQTVETISARR